MNKHEQKNYIDLLKLVKEYEHAEKDLSLQKYLLEKVNDISNIKVEKSYIDNYWSGVSLEDFCFTLAIEREQPQIHEEKEIFHFINTIIEHTEDQKKFEYYLTKYENAVEFFFRQSSGKLRELIDELYENLSTNNLVNRLKDNNVIKL